MKKLAYFQVLDEDWEEVVYLCNDCAAKPNPNGYLITTIEVDSDEDLAAGVNPMCDDCHTHCWDHFDEEGYPLPI